MTVVNKQFVFLTGLHASGTSLIGRILKRHSSVSGFMNTGVPEDEGQHLQTVIRPAMALGGPGMFAFHPEAAMDETHELATDSTRDRLLADWLHHWDPSKSHFLEKSPPTIIRTRFFQRLFPGARFIVVTRHPIAVGYGTQMWSETTTEDLLDHWLKAHERLSRDLDELEHVHCVSHEEFLASPDGVLERIQSFLGLEPEELYEGETIESNDAWFEMWQQLSKNSRSEFHGFVEKHESSCRSFGYSLTELTWTGESRLERRN